MTREQLEDAILELEYLIVHQFNPDKVQDYSNRLEELRSELRCFEEKHSSASAGE